MCGSLTKPRPAPSASRASRSRAGRAYRPRCSGVVGDPATDQTVLHHRLGEHLGRPQARVAGVVDEHRHPSVAGRGERAHPAYVLTRVGVGGLDPGDAADDVGAQVDGLADQVLGTGIAEQPVLREGHDLQVHHAAELVAQRQQRDDALEPSPGVHVGEGEHVPDPVAHGLQDRRTGVRLDPGAVVLPLHRRRELDRAQGGAQVTGGVRRQRRVAGPVQRVHLVQVQMGVHEALGDQSPGGVDLVLAAQPLLADGRDAAPVDADLPPTGPAAQSRIRDDEPVHAHAPVIAAAAAPPDAVPGSPAARTRRPAGAPTSRRSRRAPPGW